MDKTIEAKQAEIVIHLGKNWYANRHYEGTQHYLSTVANLMSSLKQIAVCDRACGTEISRCLVEGLKSRGLVVPTYNGGTQLMLSLQSFLAT